MQSHERRPASTVYQVVSSLMYGGGQRVALDLLERHCGDPEISPQLVCLGDRIVSGFPPREASWIQLEVYDGHYNRPVSLIRAAADMRRVLLAGRPDIVHSHGWDCNVVVGLACSGLSIRHIVHQHILAEWVSSKRAIHKARRAFTRLALDRDTTHWIAVSTAVKRSLEPLRWLSADKVQVIRNGVDVRRFETPRRRVENPIPVIGVAARLAPMKGLEYLLQAVAELRDRGLECELRIAGEGPERANLERVIRTLRLTKADLAGTCSAMPQFYESLDIFALPSVSTEGFPLSVLEAMASGLPVVSTLVSGIPEAVVDGVTGTLVSPRNARALADALEPLLRFPALRERMGRAGWLRANQELSVETMTTKVAELYRLAIC